MNNRSFSHSRGGVFTRQYLRDSRRVIHHGLFVGAIHTVMQPLPESVKEMTNDKTEHVANFEVLASAHRM
jgi:hypothetical protein